VRARDAEPRRSPRGGACVAHTFAAHVRACPGLVWAALTDADKTAAYLHGLAAHSTWIAGAPISFRLGDRTELTGRVLHAQSPERLSYVLQSGPHDPPTYLTWLIRPTTGMPVTQRPRSLLLFPRPEGPPVSEPAFGERLAGAAYHARADVLQDAQLGDGPDL
jgi:hypothetical protein